MAAAVESYDDYDHYEPQGWRPESDGHALDVDRYATAYAEEIVFFAQRRPYEVLGHTALEPRLRDAVYAWRLEQEGWALDGGPDPYNDIVTPEAVRRIIFAYQMATGTY